MGAHLLRVSTIVLFLAVQIGVSWAQQQSSSGVTVSQLPEPTLEALQSSIDEVDKMSVPDKDALLLRELDRVDNEIARIAQSFQRATSWKNEQSYFDTEIAARFKKQVNTLAQFDCQNNSEKIQAALQTYYRAHGDLTNYVRNMGGDTTPFNFIQRTQEQGALCGEAKKTFASPEFAVDLTQFFDSYQKKLTEFLTSQAQLALAETKYLDALKKRRAAVQDKLNASQTTLQIGSNLWLLLAILGLASVATILGIKLFGADIQMEWVASGQVIQFVTVMILLSVILALGLSSKLEESTLGTLLGGIGGYVLAQGVGRSAARAVTRAAADTDNARTTNT
jgi:hypothetical protein